MISSKQEYTAPVLSPLGVLTVATQGGSGTETELNNNGQSNNNGAKKVFP